MLADCVFSGCVAFCSSGFGCACVGRCWYAWRLLGATRRFFARDGMRRLSAPILALALAACAVGPDYKPAAAPVPTKFKELKGWKLATPSDALDRGDWWSSYRDYKLDSLLRQVEVSNQNVAVQAAAYEQARALIREAQAALFPTLTANYNATRTRTGPNAGGSAADLARQPVWRARRSAAGGTYTHDIHPASCPPSGISTSGAKSGARSKPTPPPRRRAKPISTTSSCPSRRCSPPPISICARRTRCALC